MCHEKKKNRKAKAFSCCGSEGITEMMKDCFPDDAGYTACLARMNGNMRNFSGRHDDDAAKKVKRDCCCS